MARSDAWGVSIPACFRERPPLLDTLETATSTVQHETVEECLPLLNAARDPTRNPTRNPADFDRWGVPALHKDDHVDFLHDNLAEFPAPFVGIDASRPWMVYWALLGLYLLGEDISPFRERVVKTFYPAQNATGGFGGGFGHASHLAGTYAALLSLALVGGPDAYAMIDRAQLWRWLGRLKQADGGFQICEGGEVDARGAYCALVAISLLNLPLALPDDAPARRQGLTSFLDGLGAYISRCQTYEGGMAAAPGNEAHGAYAFCAIACLCLYDAPHRALHAFLDVDALIGWLSARQYAPEGGLAGRTNKLVDGCYSHWIGGCWPLVHAALDGPRPPDEQAARGAGHELFSREGLARYILGCCQAPHGGLRDKPSKRPDSYHTCYNLSGISTVEHVHSYGSTAPGAFASVCSWEAQKARLTSDTDPAAAFDAATGVGAIHPVYVIPHDSVRAMRAWFLRQPRLDDGVPDGDGR